MPFNIFSGDPRDAARSRLWSHTAIRQRAGVERGVAGMFTLRRRATFLARLLGGDARREPALDVAPGIPRRPRQPLGFTARWSAGPRGARLASGCAGPPLFPTFGRCPYQATWDASLGLQAQQKTHIFGPSATLPLLAAPAGTHLVMPHVQGGVDFLVPGIGGAVPPGTSTGERERETERE